MMTDPTANDEAIACPVCRASQSPRGSCRRCGADLGLFVQAIESRRIGRRRLGRAIMAENHEATARLRRYLAWLGGARSVRR